MTLFFTFEEGVIESNAHLYMSKAYWYDPGKGMFQILRDFKTY